MQVDDLHFYLKCHSSTSVFQTFWLENAFMEGMTACTSEKNWKKNFKPNIEDYEKILLANRISDARL